MYPIMCFILLQWALTLYLNNQVGYICYASNWIMIPRDNKVFFRYIRFVLSMFTDSIIYNQWIWYLAPNISLQAFHFSSSLLLKNITFIKLLRKIHITFQYPFWVWYLAYFYFHQVIAYAQYLNCTSFTGLFYSLEKNQVNCNIKTKNKNTLWTKSHLGLLICNVLLACELLG